MPKPKKSTTNSSLQSQVRAIKGPRGNNTPNPKVAAAPSAQNSAPPAASDSQLTTPDFYTPHPNSRFHLQPARWSRPLSIPLALAAVAVLLAAGFSLVYAGKIYPGVTANGVYLGGLSKTQAITTLQARLDEYNRELIPVSYSDSTVRINPENLRAKYDTQQAATLALAYGRSGGVGQRLRAWIRALAGRSTNLTTYRYDYAKLTPYLDQIDADLNQPVKDASFSFSDDAEISPAISGRRLDIGRLTLLIQNRLSRTSSDNIDAPVFDLPPAIDTATLQLAKPSADRYLDGPLKLKLTSSEVTVLPTDIVNWIQVVNQTPPQRPTSYDLTRLYPLPSRVQVKIDEAKVTAFVAGLAKKIDQPGQDAALTITDGKASVFRPSRDGIALNQSKTVNQILAALNQPADRRELALDIKVKKPDVTEDSLNDLGIKELLAEGYSTFPGSSADRLTNVRVGAQKYNGVLLKPDEVFSFGALLGDVGPAQGYKPSLVIIGTKEEKQYGGGLCQVSSTAFRAALNAGLPIIERVNHSFAVDFYTQPYGVPGVDATIYYPQVDFKFKNDTGHYLLIQTIMEGTTLKFDFYGTKTKQGKIRGPQFVSGSLDATQPSHTVFYRDVLDLSGNVIKTDVFNTYYKSSKDFTIVENQFH